jgi:hypothetical protein
MYSLQAFFIADHENIVGSISIEYTVTAEVLGLNNYIAQEFMRIKVGVDADHCRAVDHIGEGFNVGNNWQMVAGRAYDEVAVTYKRVNREVVEYAAIYVHMATDHYRLKDTGQATGC